MAAQALSNLSLGDPEVRRWSGFIEDLHRRSKEIPGPIEELLA